MHTLLLSTKVSYFTKQFVSTCKDCSNQTKGTEKGEETKLGMIDSWFQKRLIFMLSH